MNKYLRIPVLLGVYGLIAVVALGGLFAGGYYYVVPMLPQAKELRDVRLQVPLAIYSRDGRLLAQFGEKQRAPAEYEDIPSVLIQAVLAAEDDRFFEHPGFDYQGYLRAGLNFLLSGGDRTQGGSTITIQVARTFFLNRDKTFVRKFKELILATRIEREFTKAEILELYLNTTFFGQHAYGVAAAARIYFGKELSDLTIAEAAIIAGIPQGPSVLNPYSNPDAAERRRLYVLRRMRELAFISETDYRTAVETPVESARYGPQLELAAPYVAEMVRAELISRLGPAVYEAGLKVTTTIDSRLQRAAQQALRGGLIDYDERHGYRGPLAQVDLAALTSDTEESAEDQWNAVLGDYPRISGFKIGLVVSVDEIIPEPEAVIALEPLVVEIAADEELNEELLEEQPPIRDRALVYFADWGLVPIELDAVAWAAPFISDDLVAPAPATVADALEPGDVTRFRVLEDGSLRLAQVPQVQGAIVSLDPLDGAVTALVGGFDFYLSNFNRATQSQRQPGSSFKPFVYSAALENGFTAATIINNQPIVQASSELEAEWRPGNYSGEFSGPTRLREALVRSLNLVSVRVIQSAGIGPTVRHLRAFGFDDIALPVNATLALGAGGVAPLNLADGYATFANGGYKVDTYLVERIEDADGDVLYAARPNLVCLECEEAALDTEAGLALIRSPIELYAEPPTAPRIITAQNAYLMNDMMQDVVRRGTGRAVYAALGRTDVAGKTGTTNDRHDAWFAGFNGDLVTAAWVGFDQERSLGRYEQGARTALPMWLDFMSEALNGVTLHAMEQPPGIIDVRINPKSGLVAATNEGSVFEKFRIGHVPEREQDRAEWQPEIFLEDGREPVGGQRQEPLF